MTALVILTTLLAIGVVFLTGFLVMMRRDNQQLREDISRTVPLRESQFTTPYVPPQQPHRAWPDTVGERDTPPPSDPAS